MDLPCIYDAVLTDMLWIHIVYQRYIIIKKGTEQTHELFTRYIPDILVRTAYTFHIPCIYHVYTMYILYIYIMYIQTLHLTLVYTMYIPCKNILYPGIYN